MDLDELAKIKVERVIKLSEKFEEMDEEEFKRFLALLENTLQIVPKNTREKKEMDAYVGFLSTMEFKKFGFIFKGFSKKGNVLLNKRDVENIVWNVHSFLFTD